MKNAKQIIDKNKEKEIKRQKDLMIDKMWDYLLVKKMKIDEAKIFLQINSVTLQQAFQNQMMKMTVGDLELEKLLAEGKDKDKFAGLLEIIKDEKIAVAKGMLDNLGDAIDNFVKEENLERMLIDLKTNWNR